MKSELLITLHEDRTITAALTDGGEFHEESFPEMTPEGLLVLVNRLEAETGVTPSFTIVDTSKPELVFDSKFLKVWSDNGYTYSERLGKDSVAFILYDKGRLPQPYALITEYKPPIKAFLTTAFGGSMDKDVSPAQIVIEEVEEEAGYKVTLADINEFGAVMVSTQSNQACHLFVVDVSKAEHTTRIPESLQEVFADVVWVSYEEILQLQDWKAPTIAAKFLKFGYNDIIEDSEEHF